jgi:hypothetical protein
VNTYHIKKIYKIGPALLFTLGAVAGVYAFLFTRHFWEGVVLAVISPILIYVFLRAVTKVSIFTTIDFIKKKTPIKEEICNWEWIRAIKTIKYYFPSYTCYTLIYWSKKDGHQQKKPLIGENINSEQNGVLVIESYISNYKHIIAYVVSKAKDIEIDQATRKIIEKDNLII